LRRCIYFLLGYSVDAFDPFAEPLLGAAVAALQELICALQRNPCRVSLFVNIERTPIHFVYPAALQIGAVDQDPETPVIAAVDRALK